VSSSTLLCWQDIADGHRHLLFFEQSEKTMRSSTHGTKDSTLKPSVCVPLENIAKMESKGCPKSESCRVANRHARFGLWLEACRMETSLQMGFEKLDSREEWFAAIRDAGGLGWQQNSSSEQSSSLLVRQKPTDPADIARRDRSKMPVLHGPSAFDVCIEPSSESTESNFIQESYYLLLTPDYIAAFFSYDDAQMHVENPCIAPPQCKFQLQGATCEQSGDKILLRGAHKLISIQPSNVASSEGPTNTDELQTWFEQLIMELDKIAAGGIYYARMMAADMPTEYAINAQVRAIFHDAKVNEQAMTSASAAIVSAVGQSPTEAQPSAASVDGADTADQTVSQQKSTLAALVKRIVDMDWQSYEHMKMPGSGNETRLVTPALVSLLDLLNDTLKAGDAAAVELFAVVVSSCQQELESQLQNLHKSFTAASSHGRHSSLSSRSYSSDDSDLTDDLGPDHRAHLLSWINNLAILSERAEVLQEKYDIDDVDDSGAEFFKLAKNCAKFAEMMVWSDFERIINDTDTALFASLDVHRSPVPVICEELFDLCIVDLRLHLSGHGHSLVTSRLFRGVVDYVMHTLCNVYVMQLADKCRSLGGLQQFRHLLEADAKHVQILIDRMELEFMESCDNIITDGSSTKVLQFTDGLKTVHRTRYPVIVSKVKDGSEAARAGARRGVTIVNAASRTGKRLRADEICGKAASITILRPSPEIGFTILRLRWLADMWHCTHAMADALGSSEKFVQAYEAMCHIQPACAFKLAYVASLDTPGLLQTLSNVDTAKVAASLCPMARMCGSSSDFSTDWWTNEHGPPSVMASRSGTQFITVVNQTDSSMKLGTANTFQQCKWWQRPPTSIGARQTFTWGAYTEGHGPVRPLQIGPGLLCCIVIICLVMAV
jgi:hypothetical protein